MSMSSVETELAASQGFAPTGYREVVLTETHYEEFCKIFSRSHVVEWRKNTKNVSSL